MLFRKEEGGEVTNQHDSSRETGSSLRFRDNGIGFPEAMDFHNTQSLGLELVHLLVGQINGTIELMVNKGTTFEITFPAES